MPRVWLSLKKSLHCKSEPSDVHDPKTQLNSILRRKVSGSSRSGCSRSISNLKDVVIHGSKRHNIEKPPSSCSPRSIGSTEFLNPITHQVILSDSKCELKISGIHECLSSNGSGVGSSGSSFVGTLKTGTPVHCFNSSLKTRSDSQSRKSQSQCLLDREGSVVAGKFGGNSSSRRLSLDKDGFSKISCHKCGEQFSKWESAEIHHLSQHAVTELVEGDSSRKIVEIICRASWLKSENHCGRIERILKVHNTQRTLARFEEYREMVKIKASKLPKKHPRCLADGNELLRFYGTTLTCSLGLNGSSSLCSSEKCSVCRIIRNGFSGKKELKDGVGVFTTSTSGKAFESIDLLEEEAPSVRKVLIVCRVIAGRVHRPLENIQEFSGQTGFDALAGKVGVYSNIEELYLLNPRALLPCFVVICKR